VRIPLEQASAGASGPLAGDWLLWGVGASLLVLLASAALVPLLVARLPVDFFSSEEVVRTRYAREHALVRGALWTLENAAGALLVLAGVTMLLLPGPGLLTIFAGLVLVDVPGKHTLLRSAVRRPRVLAGLNWIRRRAGRDPFEPPPG